MVSWDRGETLAERFRAHAARAQHLYGHVMRAMADDWESGGPRVIFAGYERAPRGSALPLRLLAGVFRLVLTDRAPELVRYYPCLGGEDPPAEAWPVVRAVLADHSAELRAALDVPPQTNEIGRSAALLAGLFDVVAAAGVRDIRLYELGASAGPNLLVDQIGFRGRGWIFGPADSPVQLTDPITGEVRAEQFTITDRGGCDHHPVDAASPEGRLLLTSFVWPFDVHRHRRLAGALSLAAEHPVQVDKASAADWLIGPLARPAAQGGLPVIWHSITHLYWPAEEQAAVESVLGTTGRHPLARISLEFASGDDSSSMPELRTTLWSPGSAPRHRRLGTAHHHGVPVRFAGKCPAD